MVWELVSSTGVVDVLVNTAANAIFDVGTAPTACTILEGMVVGDVCVLSVHMVRSWMLRRGFALRRDGGC